MQSLVSRALILLTGLVIGILGVIGVLVLLKDDGTSSETQSSSDSQQIEQQSTSETLVNRSSMSRVTND